MLDSLHIKNFRCFEDLTIPSLGQVNLIVGKNNMGKTTFLEAIYLLSTGGSAWAMSQILSVRNQFFSNYQQNPKYAFDSLQNILWNDESATSKSNELSIRTLNNIEKDITIIYDKNINNIIKRFDIKGYMPHFASGFNSSTPIECFYIKSGHSYTITTPQTLVDDIRLITPQNPIVYRTTVNVTSFQDENTMAASWDQIQDTGKDNDIENILKIIEPRLSKIYFTANENITGHRMAKVQLKNPFKAIPLKSLGEGMTRLLQIFLNISLSENGILLIDEFENGLHYSIQDLVWKELFKISNKFNVQVFATTHSEDTVKAFCKVAVADNKVDGKLISLGRSAKTSNKGQILAITFEENKLEKFIEMGMEVRG